MVIFQIIKMNFTTKTINNKNVTTLYMDAKPIIKNYKFIKGLMRAFLISIVQKVEKYQNQH